MSESKTCAHCSNKLKPKPGHPVSRQKYCGTTCMYAARAAARTVTLAEDRQQRAQGDALTVLRKKYQEALQVIERYEREQEAARALAAGSRLITIQPKHRSGTSEATAIWLASDWHVEEIVGPEVNSLNRYSPEIAKARATQFFQSGLRLTQLLAQDVQIEHIILALLGDFITNDIHEAENAEKNALQPMQAIVLAQDLLVAGIEFVLQHSTCTITIPCHSGNHGRTTKRTRFASENGHSLEYLMYQHLAAYFRHEPRVQFLIADGMHSYVKVYDTTIRFHHGHAIKYQGGVGGLFIPAYKAIAQWNKARHADLDVFGHFHQTKDGGNFLCNGSLIGYNAFALSIKADYEPPKQTLFLIDKARGRTCTWPILVEKKK